ncbi:methionyl-tRNA formyltransferase-like protein [Coniochaeta sp. 2T2.1]|nr:methionyl-tRNA formyltransferase-like protein [Coniochaeta sp. 2T2.1]
MFRVRPFIRQHLLNPRRWSSTGSKVSDPLRILFCGSDEFSAASLSALTKEHRHNPSLISSIDVAIRPPKPTGRGYKVLRPVPLQAVAKSLSLPLHTFNTFTGWTPPQPYNLIIAVSFGLFVPKRILRGAKYGGLNVHPSLLPDLRGPAPLHWALLDGRRYTGVTLQTLSEETFDSGEVLAQTPLPGIEIPKGTDVVGLRELLAEKGAEMLADGLRRGVHVPPRRDVGWVPSGEEREGIRHAPKITKKDSEVRWGEGWTAEVVARRARVLGDALWSRAVARDGKTKRVILGGVEEVAGERPEEVTTFLEGGREERKAMKDEGVVRFIAWRQSDVEEGAGREQTRPRFAVVPYLAQPGTEGSVVIPFAAGDCIRVREVKLEGCQSEPALSALKRVSYTAEEFRNLKDDPRFGGGDAVKQSSGVEGVSFGVDAMGYGTLGLLGGLLD